MVQRHAAEARDEGVELDPEQILVRPDGDEQHPREGEEQEDRVEQQRNMQPDQPLAEGVGADHGHYGVTSGLR